jgi:hypothetical protein
MMRGTYSHGVRKINGTATLTLSPTASASGTSWTVSFPNNVAARPIRIRASGTVYATITLQAAAGAPLTISVNPNTGESILNIPPAAYPSLVTGISGTYSPAGSGSIGLMVDYS